MRSDRKRVVITVAYPISITDGTTVRARQVMDVLLEDFDVVVLTRPAPGSGEYVARLKAKGIDTILRKSRKKLWPVEVMRTLPGLRPDLVYCEADLYGFLAILPLSRLMGFRAVYEAHALAGGETIQFSKAKGIIYYLMEFVVGRGADAVVALSLRARSFFRKVNSKTFFIPVFIDMREFAPSERHLSTPGKRVGLIGPFDNLFNSFQLQFLLDNLDRFDQRVSFVLIGKCPTPRASPRIQTAGFLPSLSDYAGAVRELDALLVPVEKPTLGPKNKVLEAMASGVPVFMTPEAAVGLDFAASGVNSFVFPRESIVKQMNRLLFDHAAMKRVSLGGRQTVSRWYDQEACGKDLVALVREMTR